MSIVDPDGNAASLTTTLDWWFGSGVLVPGAGFLLNNEMAEFAACPVRAPNAIAPGARMLSEMTPAIVRNAGGRVVLVTGAAGGAAIPSTVFQIISNVVDYHHSVTEAVSAPRFHLDELDNIVELEHLDEAARETLEQMGYAFQPRDHVGDAPSIGRRGDAWEGTREPRRPSSAAVGW